METLRKMLNKLKEADWGKAWEICLKLLRPHNAFALILVPVATALLIYSFVFDKSNGVISYIAYPLSAYALAVVCVKYVPLMFKKAKTIKDENKYINLYMNDTQLRVKMSLYSSLMMNTAYAIFQLGLGLKHSSVWFYSFAAYYILLAVMRFFLLRDVKSANGKKNLKAEFERCRFCGILLMIMNIALAVIVGYIVWQNRGFEHHPITTIAMALYTSVSFVLAIVNVIKYRKYQRPIYSATKAISLVAASVSVLTLETAMLNAFGGEADAGFRRIMTASTGAVVCIFTLTLAIFMVTYSTRQINKLNKKKTSGKGNANGKRK